MAIQRMYGRDSGERAEGAQDVIEEYGKWDTLDVLENANRYPGPTGFFTYITEKSMQKYLSLIPARILRAHYSRVIYVHKLPYSLYIPYCTGHSIARLLRKGLKTPTITARPAKHLDSFVDHVANYLITLQHYFSGAQAFSAVELYAGPFIRVEGGDFRYVKQQVQRMVYNLNFPSRVGMQCLSEDTKILTPEGWKTYKEIKVGDLIYTFNVKTKKIEIKRVRHVYVARYRGVMYNLRNRTQDQLISPRHRVVWKSFNSDNIRYEPIEELLKYKSPIPIPTPSYALLEQEDYPVSDDEIKLVAWILSDGAIEKAEKSTPRITIVQYPKKHLNEIIELLDKMDLKYSILDDPGWGEAKAIRLNAESSRKVLSILDKPEKSPPKWLYKLSRRQARLFLEAFVKGDGWVEEDGGTRRMRIVTTDPSIKDLLCAIAVLAGYNVSVHERKPSQPSKKLQYVITLTETRLEYIQEIREVEYDGIIWSVNTENETVIAMRKGCVFITGNTPFTNLTVILDAGKKILEGDYAIYRGQRLAPLGEYLPEAKKFLLALIEVLMEGDAIGRPFTFPIPTLMATAKMIWHDPEVHEAVFRLAAKRGSFYWLNSRIVDPDAAYAMCCRISIDKNELLYAYRNGARGLGLGFSLKKDLEEAREQSIKHIERQRFGGLWAMPDITGSINVTTVNLPRIALESRGDDTRFWEIYDNVLDIVRESEEWFRQRYIKLMRMFPSVYSMIIEYLSEFPASHFNTIGILGLPEAVAIYMQQPDLWFEGSRKDWLRAAELMRKMVSYATEKARKWMLETGVPWNVEEVPGESAAAKLAIADAKKYPELLEYLSDPENPIYSTSIAPYYGSLELSDRIDIESRVQRSFTGGVMMHIFLGEEPEPEALAKLTKRLIQTDLVYWSYTPAITVCNKCGRTFTGLYKRCPGCGSENIEVWSRIIGYYRPIRNWNPFRRREFWSRRHYGRAIL